MKIENNDFDEIFQQYTKLIMEANDLLIKMQLIKLNEIKEELENGVFPPT